MDLGAGPELELADAGRVHLDARADDRAALADDRVADAGRGRACFYTEDPRLPLGEAAVEAPRRLAREQ